jgi:signal transduction histidine kinase
MGGTLTAHSAGLGQGARFVLELPVKLEEIHA